MQGGDDQVAGEGGLGGDLGRLRVPDLPHHDDVRVLPQEGPQGPGKGEARLGVHLGLVDAGDLVLHRVLNGLGVLVGGGDALQDGEGGEALARPCGAGDEEDAVGLGDHLLEALKDPGSEAQLLYFGDVGGLLEEAHHRLLPVDGGQGGEAEVQVNGPFPVAHAAVLGEALLGDVEPAHDLDDADHRAQGPLGQGGVLAQGAVHAEAYQDVGGPGLYVDVGSVLQIGLADDLLDELLGGALVQLPDGRFLFLLVALGELLGQLPQLLLAVEALNELGDGRLGGHRRGDLVVKPLALEGQAHVVQGQDVAGVLHEEDEGLPLHVVGKDPVAPGQVLGDEEGGPGVRGVFLGVDVGVAQLRGHRLGQGLGLQLPRLDQGVLQAPSTLPLLLQGLLHVLGPGQAQLHQDLPQRLGLGEALLHLQGLPEPFPGEAALLDQDLSEPALFRVGPVEEVLPGLGEREEKAGGAAQELLHRLQVPGVGQNHLHLSLADGHGHSAIPEGIGAEEEGGGRRV